MKKFFTFAAALMASVAMMAVVPAGTLNPANVPSTGWAGKATPTYVENGDWMCFLPYEIYQSIATGLDWAAADKSGSTSATWSAADPIPANTAWSGEVKAATVRDDNGGSNQKGAYYYRVTNVSDVAILAKSGSAGKRTVSLEAFELTAGVPAETAAQSATTESNDNTLLSISGLSTANEYLVVVKQIAGGSKGTSAGNSNYYAIAFKTIVSTDPVLNVNPAEIDLNVTASATNPSATVTFSGKNLAAGTYGLTLPELAGLTVTPASVTVGEDGKLNAEVTISYTSDVEIAANSTTVGLTIGALTKSVTVNYSAVLAKSYMSSLNIEGLVVAQGTKANIVMALASANIEVNKIDALDSLSTKADRNEPYLGLKLQKSTEAYVAGWVEAGHTLRIKFGNMPGALSVTLNGVAAADLAEKEYEFAAAEDTYVKIAPKGTGSKLVLKQVMIDEPLVKIMYAITYSIGEGGTVTGWPVAYPNEEVVMDITSNEGYALHNIAYNGTAMVQTAPGAPISFIMPAEDVTVTADFGDVATAINNTEATVKAVKRIVNGQLFIEKNGVLYNAQGATVK